MRYIPAIALAAALACAPAAAQELYKLIDKNGKVTYSEKPPKDFDGKVIKLTVNPDANTATLPKPPAKGAAGDEGGARRDASQRAADRAAREREAREKLDAAKRELKDAQDNPGEGDIARMGKVGGGTRPVPTEEYQRRLANLEKAVREAEAELRAIQEGR